MADFSKIQWTDHTWNPWQGCTKVGPGCDYCYMYRDKIKYGQDPFTLVRSKDPTFYKPYKWHNPAKVFTCSWSDFYHIDADPYRIDAYTVIDNTPLLEYQILTKRPERILKNLPQNWGNGYDNVWMGVTGENEMMTFKRLKKLLNVPAKIRFLSAEPLLESVVSPRTIPLLAQLDWIIVGGESGNNTGQYLYRPCDQVWIEELIQFGQTYNVPIFVKQLGTYLSGQLSLKNRHAGDITEWPAHLQIRQMP